MLMKKRFGGYSSDSRSTGTSAEDVLMEALMDHSTSKMTSNTGSLNPESIGISCEDGEEVDSCHEELATKPSNRNDRLPDWHDLTDDDLYELLLEIEEELQVDGTYGKLIHSSFLFFSLRPPSLVTCIFFVQLFRRGVAGRSIGGRAHFT